MLDGSKKSVHPAEPVASQSIRRRISVDPIFCPTCQVEMKLVAFLSFSQA